MHSKEVPMNGKWLLTLLPTLGFLLWTAKSFTQEGSLQITSPAFGHNQTIPREYTCQGADVNPILEIRGIPPGAKSPGPFFFDPPAPGGGWGGSVGFHNPAR